MYNCWFMDPSFKNFVTKEWEMLDVQGWGIYVLKEKLKRLKEKLKEWNRDHCGMLDKKISEQMDIVNVVDEKVNFEELTDEDVTRRREASAELWKRAKQKDSLMSQKSRLRWLKDGDSNSKYFHTVINRNRRVNAFTGIDVDGQWIEDPDWIKDNIRQFFEDKFRENYWNRPTLDGIGGSRTPKSLVHRSFDEKGVLFWWCTCTTVLHVHPPVLDGINFKKISNNERCMLTARFEEEEIKEAVWNCDGDKSPGPDGYNFTFIKNFWSCLKNDIIKMVDNFYERGCFPRGSNASFLVLIPKCNSPQGYGDFRPISLVGCIYKILSKLLAARLKKVMGSIISQCQSAFISGRFILDGAVVANEIIDFAKKKKKKCLIFKVDFEKAYDSVNWGFLNYMMERMGFCHKWRSWITSCLNSASVSILVNGCATKEFSMERGLRQGDPMAPFLFLIVAEGLSGLMRAAVDRGIFNGFKVGDDQQLISHLQYADDTLLVGDYSDTNIKAMKSILKCFELASGLKINFNKSNLIGVNVDANDMGAAVQKLNCKAGNLQFKYLGIPIGANPNRVSTWNPIIESFKKKLSCWKQKLLSFGGRLTLINAVLSALPIYLFSFYKAPKKVINELTMIQRRFLWGGSCEKKKVAWVRWDHVCRSKENGGLGVKDLEIFNLSLLAKWRWRIITEDKSLWVSVLKSLYGSAVVNGGVAYSNDIFQKGSMWWRSLGKLGLSSKGIDSAWFSTGVRRSLGRGTDILFWKDIWEGDESLQKSFHRLFTVAVDKEAKISDMGEWREGEWYWNFQWRRSLFQWELQQLDTLTNRIKDSKPLLDKDDWWFWKHDKSGTFTVKQAYEFNKKDIGGREDSIFFKILWTKYVPTKMSALAWKVFLNGVPTRLNLRSRGILNNNVQIPCVLCGDAEESTNHIFFACSKSYNIWLTVYRWFDLHSVLHNDVRYNLLSHGGTIYKRKPEKQAWMSIWFVTIWTIWSVRNRIIFQNHSFCSSEVMGTIYLKSWSILKANLNSVCFSFGAWVMNPSVCIKMC
ncbi:hypothetical protein OROGR_002051 [Orobanche gracilis]